MTIGCWAPLVEIVEGPIKRKKEVEMGMIDCVGEKRQGLVEYSRRIRSASDCALSQLQDILGISRIPQGEGKSETQPSLEEVLTNMTITLGTIDELRKTLDDKLGSIL